MECTSCGAHNEAGLRFCIECGSPLAQGCPSCGRPVAPQARFCGHCGTELVAVVPAQAAAVPVAERRMCSVLFCDLVGFTPLSEARDPEEVRELLSAYFDAASTVIRRYGGVVEKFIGDAVMAVWGTPVATEGDAERAVRAALDLMDAVDQLGSDRGIPDLAARAGVVTGEVAVTIGATNEGMVAGDAVNTAARVQSVATAGQVLVDTTTRRLRRRRHRVRRPGGPPAQGQGRARAAVARDPRVVRRVGGAQRVDGLEAPLTGRDAEMRTIRELFHAAAERRVPRLVLRRRARPGWASRGWAGSSASTSTAWSAWSRWHSGRCLSYGEGASFWALAEIVRQRFGIAEDDLPETVGGEAGRRASRDGCPTRTSAATSGSGSAGCSASPSPTTPAASSRRRSCSPAGGSSSSGWRAVEPVVLMVEDAQHADAGLLDFLDHLVDWVRDLPIYLLVFARPELEQTPARASAPAATGSR